MSPDPAQRARAAAIADELSAIGLALPGTLIRRQVRCGNPRCACHASPPRRLRELVAELEALTLAIADTRPGQRKPPRKRT